ncbi:hypothetical protein [Actinokineospora sp. HUAS TT18]|uniref:hypothetical protein n=1 Tax=Actinokineospora sp. HUAS TT18 TaxID=3447451 RepID=UPI003F5262DF
MNDPSGAVSRGVYLRRRAYAVAGSVLGVVALVWLIGGLVGSEGDPELQGLVAALQASAPPSTVSSPPPASSSTAPPSSSGETPPPAPTTPPPPPPDPNLPCPDAAIGVTAEVGAPAYRVGQRPALKLVVTNAGPVPCTRDVSDEARELVITSPDGSVRVWSSNDCYSPKGPEPRIMQPGERLEFAVNWAGRTSAPGCPRKRTTVQAGVYAVTPHLGALVGPAVPLTLTR